MTFYRLLYLWSISISFPPLEMKAVDISNLQYRAQQGLELLSSLYHISHITLDILRAAVSTRRHRTLTSKKKPARPWGGLLLFVDSTNPLYILSCKVVFKRQNYSTNKTRSSGIGIFLKMPVSIAQHLLINTCVNEHIQT